MWLSAAITLCLIMAVWIVCVLVLGRPALFQLRPWNSTQSDVKGYVFFCFNLSASLTRQIAGAIDRTKSRLPRDI